VILAFVFALAASSISGIVKDTSGGAVPGAAVIVRAASGAERQTLTGADGRFTIETPDGEVNLVVRAGGFAEKTQKASSSSGSIEIIIEPATLLETVTVTPTRTEQRLGDVPASVSVLTSEAIEASPALLADDVLRQVPSFSLFRRTSGDA
jgi:iron complex outermembrane receptor protein